MGTGMGIRSKDMGVQIHMERLVRRPIILWQPLQGMAHQKSRRPKACRNQVYQSLVHRHMVFCKIVRAHAHNMGAGSSTLLLNQGSIYRV